MAAAYIIRNRLQALKLAAGFCVYSDSKRFRCLFCHMRQYSSSSVVSPMRKKVC